MTFSSILSHEANLLIRRRYIITVFCIYIIFVFLVYFGIGEYKNQEEKNKKFIETERERIDLYHSWDVLGTYGIRFLLVPRPYSILSANTLQKNIVARSVGG